MSSPQCQLAVGPAVSRGNPKREGGSGDGPRMAREKTPGRERLRAKEAKGVGASPSWGGRGYVSGYIGVCWVGLEEGGGGEAWCSKDFSTY